MGVFFKEFLVYYTDTDKKLIFFITWIYETKLSFPPFSHKMELDVAIESTGIYIHWFSPPTYISEPTKTS